MRKAKRAAAAALAVCLCGSLWGCDAGDGATGAGAEDTRAEGASDSGQATQSGADGYDLEFTKRDQDPSFDEASATQITLAGDAARVEGAGATADGATVRITQEGTYVMRGELTDGQVQVEVGDEEKVQVVLAGVDIHNEAGPAFYVKNADKVFLTLAEGTSNALSDGTEVAADEDGDELNAALLSKDDLTINGAGALSVQGNCYHAIKSSDDLVICGGIFEVTSVEDAFHGNDCVKVADGSFIVNAGDDAFHSDLLTYFAGGTVEVQSCYEGYEGQAVIIDGGTHDVVASDDALNAALADSSADGVEGAQSGATMPGQAQDQGQMQPPQAGGQAMDQPAEGDLPQMPEGADAPQGAGGEGMQRGGRGAMDAAAGGQPPELPDGAQAPDGMNGAQPPDDAQAPDGTDGAADPGAGGGMRGGGGGEAMAASSESCLIQINGGELHLVGGNDAIDSNGNVELNGGTVVACGPAMGMDGALDYDLNATINGGTVLLVGSIGSTRGLDASPQEYRIEELSGQAGTLVQLLDADGTVLAQAEAPTAFQSVLASAPGYFTVTTGQLAS